MRVALVISLAVLLACPGAGGNQALYTYSDAMSSAVLAQQTSVEFLYYLAQSTAMDLELAKPDHTEDSVRGAVLLVRQKWSPVRSALSDVESSHAELVRALSYGADDDLLDILVLDLSAKHKALNDALIKIKEN